MTATTPRPRGPRGGDAHTRDDIVAAARRVFSDVGYDRGSMRAIAREADVDASLPRHYFASKSELFVEAIGPLDRMQHAASVIATGGPEGLGERVVRTFLSVWDSDEYGDRVLMLIRAATSNPEVAQVLARTVYQSVLLPVASSFSTEDVERRAAAAASQMIGLAMARYLLRFPGLADAEPEDVVAMLAPTMQRYLAGSA